MPGFTDSLETCYEQGFFEVIAEVPTHYAGIAPSDPVMNPLFLLQPKMAWPQSFAKSIESIESAEFLTKEQRDAILYENAARFLGLEED
jgi:hypothetical protein